MEAIRLYQTVNKDGEISVTGLPFKKGQKLEIIMLPEAKQAPEKKNYPTARQLLASGLVGMWKDRQDIQDSTTFARQLREKAQNRRWED